MTAPKCRLSELSGPRWIEGSLPRVPRAGLRLLAERRDDLATERVRVLNRLHVLFRELIPGGAPVDLTAEKAATLMRGVRLITTTDLARDLLADRRRMACSPK